MISIADKSMCSGCTACVSTCPKNCIKMRPDAEGFLYPVVDVKTCINCGLCEKVCPFREKFQLRENKPLAFAVKSKDENIRLKSSSGGVFSEFANYIISKKGSVYGASMNDKCDSAEHIRVSNEEKLEKLMGSKYLQSDLKESFKLVKEDLIKGLDVLFTGTPCQVRGLINYLGRPYDNLYTVEVICHGVPSMLLWKKYKDYLENTFKSAIANVNFRERKTGGVFLVYLKV